MEGLRPSLLPVEVVCDGGPESFRIIQGLPVQLLVLLLGDMRLLSVLIHRHLVQGLMAVLPLASHLIRSGIPLHEHNCFRLDWSDLIWLRNPGDVSSALQRRSIQIRNGGNFLGSTRKVEIERGMSSEDEAEVWQNLSNAFEADEIGDEVGLKDNIGSIRVQNGQYQHVCMDNRVLRILDKPEKVSISLALQETC